MPRNFTSLLFAFILVVFASCSKDKNESLLKGLFLEGSDSTYAYLQQAAAYGYFTADKRSTLFSDDFVDDSKGWATGNGRTIEDGQYKLTAPYFSWINHTSIDFTQDLEIEYVCSLVPAFSWDYTNDYEGLIFGFETVSVNQSANVVGIGTGSNAGQNPKYITTAVANTSSITPSDKIFFSAFSDQGKQDKITIRKIYDQYFVFVNEQLVFRRSFPPISGGKFGFLSAGNLWIDKIKIDYLEK